MSGPKILVLDIETSPSDLQGFGLFDQNFGLNQITTPTRVICFAAKWHGSRKTEFYSEFAGFGQSHEEMVDAAWELLDYADAAAHWNGTSFDMPHLRREFYLAEKGPTSPVRDIDLLRTFRRQFRFLSNKLDWISQESGIGSKIKHEGHALWRACLNGDAAAWKRMRRYNIGDTVLTDRLLTKAMPWVAGMPHAQLFSESGEDCCQRCGSVDLVRKGFAYTPGSKFQQYKCRDCGSWSRGKKALLTIGARGIG